jgi:flagellar FliL protein
MAKEDELDLDTTKKKAGGKGKLIIIIVLAVLLTTGTILGVLYFTGNLGGGGKQDNSGEASEEKTEKELVIQPAFYFDLQPAFVVNFEDKTHAAYLQVEMQLMSRDKAVNEQITKHMPVIRNNILLILSAQQYEVVKSRQGKEQLQAKVLEEVRGIVGPAMLEELKKESEGEINAKDVPNVEQVYFTSFIMQ